MGNDPELMTQSRPIAAGLRANLGGVFRLGRKKPRRLMARLTLLRAWARIDQPL